MNDSLGTLAAMFFPKQLTEFQFFIRSIALGLFVFFSGLLLATMDIENRAVTLYGLLAIFLVLKAYHILCVIGPRFRDIGLDSGYAAFALIPFLGLVIFVGCCFAPAGWWRHATGPTPPPLPREPGERARDEY